MINSWTILAAQGGTLETLQGLTDIGKLGVAVITALVSLGVILIAWSNSRGSNKIAAVMLATVGDALKRYDKIDTRLDDQENKADERHKEVIRVRTEFAQAQTEHIAVLKQLVGAVGTMKDEVVAMRNDNHGMQDLRKQLDLLQKTTERQAQQLEEQALEISTLRESNAALIDNLEAERKARTAAEIQLAKEREIARQNEERNAKSVQLLKDQFNTLQREFALYKAKMNDKDNKEARLKDDLSQHTEQSDPTDE